MPDDVLLEEKNPLMEHALEVAEFFRSMLEIEHKPSVPYIDLEKDHVIINLTGQRVTFWNEMSMIMPGNIEMIFHLFKVGDEKTNQGVALNNEDKVVLLINDADEQNFFVVDAPKLWNKESREGEAWRLQIVNDSNELCDTKQLESFDEFLENFRSKKLVEIDPGNFEMGDLSITI